MKMSQSLVFAGLMSLLVSQSFAASHQDVVSVGPRPFALIDQMTDSALKDKLLSCAAGPFRRTDFSIGHRGAPLQFPEHTQQSYLAAVRMGAGAVECDVTFTKDKKLVCRHSQNDLHTTTDILATPLASYCTAPFQPASGSQPASADCRTSDITLSEFRSLTGKMDASVKSATTVGAYMGGVAGWRTDLYAASGGTMMSHADYIALLKPLGVKFTPELKRPVVAMPFDGLSQENYAQQLIDEYRAAGVPPSDVWVQSFHLDDVLYWISAEPEFGRQAVYLDASFRRGDFDAGDPATFRPSMAELKAMGVNYIAPPMWVLVKSKNGAIVPSAYALEARKAGLKLITWTLERSGPLLTGGGWYYQSISNLTDNDGVVFELLDVLAKDVGVDGIFSDWPATVTYYASCMGLE